ncbi:MAG TPA: NUDIX hydrolase [Candidatus Paceibacterota bacterium]|nr:NUDIX hydrolase [Candidatus Paceibacterota bacterium]
MGATMPIADVHGPWVSLVLVRVMPDNARYAAEQLRSKPQPAGFIFVINRTEYGSHAKYKMPGGGRISEDRDPRDTAVREMFEETGIQLPPERLAYVERWFGGRNVPHWKYLFCADISEMDAARRNDRHSGNEGEIPEFVTPDDLKGLIRRNMYLEVHRQWLIKLGVIPKDVLAA